MSRRERDGWFPRVPGGPRKERVGKWTGRPRVLHMVLPDK